MVLVTQADIEQYSGFQCLDFTDNGQPMEAGEWKGFLAMLIPKVTQMIHRFCGVYSFEPALFTEYHNGKGANNYDSAVCDYNEEDLTYYLRQLYLNDGSLTISEDIATNKISPPLWTNRWLRPVGPLAEQDTVLITGPAQSNGNISFIFNGSKTLNVAITSAMTIPQICAAVVAAGPQIDNKGIVWTPSLSPTSPYVAWTAGVTGNQLVVQINPNSTGTAMYVTQTICGNSQYSGDYEMYQENDVTWIRYFNNIPAPGNGNIRFTYNTGYPIDSPQLADIKFQALRAVNNILLTKKKIQEANTIRNFGVRDYSMMFDAFSEGVVLDDRIKVGLEQYRRAIIPGVYTYE